MTKLTIDQILPNVRQENGLYSVLDVIRVCGQDNPYEVVKRLQNNYPGILTICEKTKFMRKDGRGRTKATYAANPKNMLQIIGLLPGVIGQKYREEAASLMNSFLTNKAGLAIELIDSIQDSEELKKIEKRAKGKIARLNYCDSIDNNLPSYNTRSKSLTQAICTNKIYQGLFGGKAQELKDKRGLTRKQSLRDSMSYEELVALEFAEMVAGKAVKSQDHTNNGSKMATTSQKKAEAIRKLL